MNEFDYYLEKHIKQNWSNGNYRFYKNKLGHFKNYMADNNIISLSDVTSDTIIDYIDHMHLTCTNSTINKNIGVLKRAFEFLKIENDYLKNWKKLKETKRTFDMIEFDEFKEARKLDFTNCINGVLYRTILILLGDTGARVNEILSIEKKNIDLLNKQIKLVQTKTKEDRFVYLSNVGVTAVKEMLKIKTDHKYLLHNQIKKRPASYNDVRYVLKLVLREFNLNQLHAHMFRHTFATMFLEISGDLFSLMKILGHSNVETTKRYLHVSNKYIRSEYEKLTQFMNA